MNVKDMMERARAIEPGEGRDLEVLKLLESERAPALVSLVLEFEEDLARSVADYNRSAEERAMDAGGLATMRKFRETLEGIMTPAPKDAEAPKPIVEV